MHRVRRVLRRTSSDLVSPDYYEQELRYQTQIERLERSRALGFSVSVNYEERLKGIRIAFPSGQFKRRLTGEIQLYRPSSAKLDRNLKLDLDATGAQFIDTAGLQPGLWKVRLTWKDPQNNYYTEQPVVVGP